MGNVIKYDYQPPAVRDIKKADLIGMVTVGLVSTLIITIIIIKFIIYIKKTPISKSMKYLALGHLIGDWVFCFFAAFIRSDVLFPIKYNRDPPNTHLPYLPICRLAVFPQFSFYYISKAFLYLFFIQRIKITFKESIHECNKCFIASFQIIVITSESILLFMFIIFQKFQYCSTNDDKLHICSSYTEDIPANIGGLAVELITIFDIIFSIITLFIFVYKLRKLAFNNLNTGKNDYYVQLTDIDCARKDKDKLSRTKTVSFYSLKKSNAGKTHSHSMDRVSKLVGVTLKCCVLSSVGMISNFIFLFVADVWLFDLSWFIQVDALLNAICVYFMFQFTEKQYNVFCKPIIVIWRIFGECCGLTKFNLTSIDGKSQFQDEYI